MRRERSEGYQQQRRCAGVARSAIWRSVRMANLAFTTRLRARQELASCDGLNPLAAPGGGLKGVGEVLGLVHDLTVTELHDAYGECGLALVGDGVFVDPEIAASEDSPDVEARGLAGMMAAQGL